MLVCPQCQAENPENNKFCQKCGTSLTAISCPSCQASVPVNAESCPHCGAPAGVIWRALVIPLFEPSPDQSAQPDLLNDESLSPQPPQPTLDTDLDSQPVHEKSTPLGQSVAQPAVKLFSTTMAQEDGALTVDYLDPKQRYQLLDALPSGLDSDMQLEVRVLDCNPFQPSPLMKLYRQFLTEDGKQSSDSEGAFQQSVPAIAQLYLELQDELYPVLPKVYDAWEQDDYAIVLLEDRTELPLLLEFWQDPNLLPIQILHWMHEITELWTVLETWSACESLLDLLNLRVDEDQVICLQQLHFDDPDNPPQLTELGRLWRQLYEQSQRIPVEPIAYLCAEVESGEIGTIEQLHNRFEAIADELQPTPPPFIVAPETYQSKPAAAVQESFQKSVHESTDDEPVTATLPSEPASEPASEPWVPEDSIPESSIPEGILPDLPGLPDLPPELRERLADDDDDDEDATRLDGDDSPTVVLPMKLTSLEDAGQTDVGKQREHNEDFFTVQTEFTKLDTPSGRTLHAKGLYVLCDGMGGHASGEVASALAVETLKTFFETHWTTELPDEDTIRAAIVEANRAIFDLNQQSDRSGVGRMGTTLVMVLIQDAQVAVAHVGDSRLYRFKRRAGLEQITVDHEVGQREIQRGVEPGIAYARPDAYQLTQALGPRDENFIDPDVEFLELTEDQLLILCSDGLSDNDVLENHCRTHVEPLLSSRTNLEQGVSQLIDLANHYNGHDNITAIVIRAKLRPNLDLQS